MVVHIMLSWEPINCCMPKTCFTNYELAVDIIICPILNKRRAARRSKGMHVFDYIQKCVYSHCRMWYYRSSYSILAKAKSNTSDSFYCHCKEIIFYNLSFTMVMILWRIWRFILSYLTEDLLAACHTIYMYISMPAKLSNITKSMVIQQWLKGKLLPIMVWALGR